MFDKIDSLCYTACHIEEDFMAVKTNQSDDENSKKPDESARSTQGKDTPKSDKKNDGSSKLNTEIEQESTLEETDDNDDYPYLEIVAGKQGNVESYDNGALQRTPLKDGKYAFPIDFDVVKINANVISLIDWYGNVTDLGNVVLNAQQVNFSECPSLKTLPPIHMAAELNVDGCSVLKTLNPDTVVKHLNLSDSGVVFLPESLRCAQIKVAMCNNLRYIHTAIPSQNIMGLSHGEIQKCKVNFLLSDVVSDAEKDQYPLEDSKIQFYRDDIEYLPACLKGYRVSVSECPRLRYIHPALAAHNITGLTPKAICQMKMQYLFSKSQSNDEFQKFFPILNRLWQKRFAHTRD